jgi:hypothetical protein
LISREYDSKSNVDVSLETIERVVISEDVVKHLGDFAVKLVVVSFVCMYSAFLLVKAVRSKD